MGALTETDYQFQLKPLRVSSFSDGLKSAPIDLCLVLNLVCWGCWHKNRVNFHYVFVCAQFCS